MQISAQLLASVVPPVSNDRDVRHHDERVIHYSAHAPSLFQHTEEPVQVQDQAIERTSAPTSPLSEGSALMPLPSEDEEYLWVMFCLDTLHPQDAHHFIRDLILVKSIRDYS